MFPTRDPNRDHDHQAVGGDHQRTQRVSHERRGRQRRHKALSRTCSWRSHLTTKEAAATPPKTPKSSTDWTTTGGLASAIPSAAEESFRRHCCHRCHRRSLSHTQCDSAVPPQHWLNTARRTTVHHVRRVGPGSVGEMDGLEGARQPTAGSIERGTAAGGRGIESRPRARAAAAAPLDQLSGAAYQGSSWPAARSRHRTGSSRTTAVGPRRC